MASRRRRLLAQASPAAPGAATSWAAKPDTEATAHLAAAPTPRSGAEGAEGAAEGAARGSLVRTRRRRRPLPVPRTERRLAAFVWLSLLAVCHGEVRSGDSINLQAHTGKRISVEGSEVVARWAHGRSDQTLIIEGIRDGPIHSGEVVFLRTPSGRYLDADGDQVEARWGNRGKWQAMIVETPAGHGEIRNGDPVFFRTHTGNYIAAEDYDVRARWPDQGSWQRFVIQDEMEQGGAYDLFHGALDVIGTGCGFVNVPEDMDVVLCNKAMETDCTTEEHVAKACPSVCPYVAKHQQLSCVYQCTLAEDCAKANPEVAYANNLTKVCEPCEVVGCRRCSSKQVCAECFDNFWLEFGGRACMYVWDERATHGVHAAAALVLALLLLASIVVVIADHCACCGHCLPKEMPDESPEHEPSDDDLDDLPLQPPNLEESSTSKAIRQGKRHRARCKLRDLKEPDKHKSHGNNGTFCKVDSCESTSELQEEESMMGPRSPSAWQDSLAKLPIWTDFRATFLTGVGLPLFHQWYRFLFLYSVLMTAGTFWVYRYSELGGVLQKTAMEHASEVLHGEEPMAACGLRERNNDQLGDSVRAFAHRAALVYFVLWVVGFCLSIVHAARQKSVAAEFYRRHPCLAEFAINVEGFPSDATDEVQIRNYLRAAFNTDDLEVSVCYDFRSRRQRVHELLEKVLVNADVRAGTYDASMAVPSARSRRSTGLTSTDQAEILSWLQKGQGGGGVRNAGHVFAIFQTNHDLIQCRRKFEEELGDRHAAAVPAPVLPDDATPRWLPAEARPLMWVDKEGKMHELLIRDVVCEPPDVVWENLGLQLPRLIFGYIVAGFAILVSFVTMATGIFLPLASYSINYVMQAGSLPTGVMMTVLGTLVMAANWGMCFVHSSASSFVGFARRDREGLLLFRVFATLCLSNFLFNVLISLFPESQANAFEYILHPIGRGLVTMQGIAFQARVSAHFFHVLVPGGLFFGYLIWPLQGFVWPFASTLAYLRCRYRKFRFVPARAAELALEPLGISIPHDYMGTVVQPTSCSLVLFFASDSVWQTFACLVAWSLFMMPFMRYLHTRQVRRYYFTTNRLDVDVLFMWGFPLSMVLAASCFWAAQIFEWSLYVVPLAWAAGIALYVVVLAHGVRPLIPPKSEGRACNRKSYDEVCAMRRYDWHNCNPIKVLLSHCDGVKGEAIVPYFVGKEYLQERATQKLLRRKSTMGSILEHERSRLYEDEPPPMSSTWHFIPTLPEVEALINGPLEALGAFSQRPQPSLRPTVVLGAESDRISRQGSRRASRSGSHKDSLLSLGATVGAAATLPAAADMAAGGDVYLLDDWPGDDEAPHAALLRGKRWTAGFQPL